MIWSGEMRSEECGRMRETRAKTLIFTPRLCMPPARCGFVLQAVHLQALYSYLLLAVS